jgi:hypothetical protein
MPPRVTGSRVTSVGEGRGARPKAVTPSSMRHPNFKSTAAAVAKRQKISPEMASERLKRTRGK